MVKDPPANAGDVRDSGSIPGLGRSPGGGHGKPLQYSYLENPMDRGGWLAIVYRVEKSRTRPKHLSTHAQRLTVVGMWSGHCSLVPGHQAYWEPQNPLASELYTQESLCI